MPETIELEEITFEAPTPCQPVIVNPDRFLEKLLAKDRGCLTTPPSRNRIRASRWGKILICISCMLGECLGCEENGCPCPHHDCQRENLPAPALGPEVEEYCWPV